MGYDNSGFNWVYYNLSSSYTTVTIPIILNVSLNPSSIDIIAENGGVYIKLY